MKICVFDIKFEGKPEMEPITIDVDKDADINTAIVDYFVRSCGAAPVTFDWEYDENPVDALEKIRETLRRLKADSSNFSAQDAVDEIRGIVGDV